MPALESNRVWEDGMCWLALTNQAVGQFLYRHMGFMGQSGFLKGKSRCCGGDKAGLRQ